MATPPGGYPYGNGQQPPPHGDPPQRFNFPSAPSHRAPSYAPPVHQDPYDPPIPKIMPVDMRPLPNQNSDGGGNQQHWKAISVWSRVGRRFTLWYNRAGCMGNAWHDSIGVLKPFQYSNAILYTRSWCDESTYIGWNANHCFWKRNGK